METTVAVSTQPKKQASMVTKMSDDIDNIPTNVNEFSTINDASDDTTKYRVGDADIGNKTGNYIFTIGNVSAGKSTLQNLLIYRLWSREDILFEYSNKDGDHRHDKLLDDWVKRLQMGYLPDRTTQGLLQEFNITISQKRKKQLEINFLEISGEDIKSIVPTLDIEHKPKINEQLVAYLSTTKTRINKRFIFVSNAEENKKNKSSPSTIPEDILFNHFLTYLLGKNGLAMTKIKVLFVATKWDVVRSEYNTVQEYFRKNFPQTRGKLQSSKCETVFIPFSVGAIEKRPIDEKKTNFEERIISLESRYVDLVIQWIYLTFTGNSLKGMPKISDSLLDKLRVLFN